MIALTPVELDGCALTAFGYDPTTATLALTFANDSDVWHYQDVPQDVADGLAACVNACQNPSEQLFDAEAMSPDRYLSAYVRGTTTPIYGYTKVSGAAAADIFNQADPTLPPPSPSPAPRPAPAPAPTPSPSPAPAQG